MTAKKSSQAKGRPEVGEAAPAFTAKDDGGATVKLSDFKGRHAVVLYFYPRDNTPGCTVEACAFRDDYKKYGKANAVVLGVSTDTAASHLKFKNKFELPFQLLVDEEHALAEKYGVWVEKNMYGKKSMGILRTTFLIDKAGKVAAVWPKVKVEGHSEVVLKALAELID